MTSSWLACQLSWQSTAPVFPRSWVQFCTGLNFYFQALFSLLLKQSSLLQRLLSCSFLKPQLLIVCCFKGVVIKYNEPIEARKPRTRWRLYPFKGEEAMCTYLKAQKCFVLASQDYHISLKLTPLVKAKMKPAPVMNTPYWSLNCFCISCLHNCVPADFSWQEQSMYSIQDNVGGCFFGGLSRKSPGNLLCLPWEGFTPFILL